MLSVRAIPLVKLVFGWLQLALVVHYFPPIGWMASVTFFVALSTFDWQSSHIVNSAPGRTPFIENLEIFLILWHKRQTEAVIVMGTYILNFLFGFARKILTRQYRVAVPVGTGDIATSPPHPHRHGFAGTFRKSFLFFIGIIVDTPRKIRHHLKLAGN